MTSPSIPSWRSPAYLSLVLALGIGAAALGGCSALVDDMHRAETNYDEARYEDALTWLTDLESDAPSMDRDLRARYYYLRGMTEYRLSHRPRALHYLALAREVSGDDGAGLTPQWRQLMERSLEELTPTGRDHHPRDANASESGAAGADDSEADDSESSDVGSSDSEPGTSGGDTGGASAGQNDDSQGSK